MLNRNNSLLLIAFLSILVGGYLIVSHYTEEGSSEVDALNERLEEWESEEEVSAEPLSGFSWYFAEADTNNPDGNPQTEIYLTANYGNDNLVEKLVDIVDGGCSELEGESYENDVSNTAQVQCYYAGLGQQYRIVESNDSYVVERKLFEEALPDYTPPSSQWETVINFPISY